MSTAHTASSEPSSAPQAPAHPFARATGRARGYEPGAVDAFLARARETFQAADGDVTSDDVRCVSFPLVREGYQVEAVDAALARLEDAFAQRERETAIADAGVDRWVADARAEAQEILVRMSRAKGRRFDRVGWTRVGYAVSEVDAVTTRLARFFSHGDAVSVEQVRQAAFHPQRGGYREEQVDAVLDAVVRVMLAVR